MTEQVLELLKKLCAADQDETVMRLLCQAACSRLRGMLASGATLEDCGEMFPLAAAYLIMDWLDDLNDGADITALSAGDLTVRREGGQRGRGKEQAMTLLAPWLRDEGFVFRGVRG